MVRPTCIFASPRQQVKTMRRVPWFLALILLLGCAGSRLAQLAPVIFGPSAPPPAISVALTDARPSWERRSKKCVVEFKALEDCEPPPWSLLTGAIQREAGSWPEPPSRADVAISSFRVVVKKEGKTGSTDDFAFGLPQIPISSGAHNGYAALGALALVGAVITVEVGIIMAKVMIEEGMRCERDLRGPPYNLDKDYSPGVTCDIKARVSLQWKDNRTRTTEISATVNGGPPGDDSAASRLYDIHQTVHRATEVLAEDWSKKNSGRPPGR
jgi:hypothetical protein